MGEGNIIMIVTNIEDFENNVRRYLDKAKKRKPDENIFIEYGDKHFILMSEESLENALWGALNQGMKIGGNNNSNISEGETAD